MTAKDNGGSTPRNKSANQKDGGETGSKNRVNGKQQSNSPPMPEEKKTTGALGEEKNTVTTGDQPSNAEKKSADAANEKRDGAKAKSARTSGRKMLNNLREYRIEQMMSKAELARKAGLSVLTIDRIEKGFGCRMDTKRKILKALGLSLSDRRKVFKDD